jgi:hypothetical protein
MTKNHLSRHPRFCDKQAVDLKKPGYFTRDEIRRRIAALAKDRPSYIAWLEKRYGRTKG